MDANGAAPAARLTSNTEARSRGVQGHLNLVCTADAEGRSYLSHQSFRAPMHLSKPHLDEGVLVVNVINPTAGLLSGDRVECRVDVESGAALLLSTPSASRVHRMSDGIAEVSQELRVQAGGRLESWPELLIPQGGARYRQRTKITVERGGELLFFESLAPGRVASGEAFQFTELSWEMDLFSGDAHIARERYRITPGDEAIATLRAVFDCAYYASCFVVSSKLPSSHPCWQRIHDGQDVTTRIGCGTLGHGGAVIKVLAEGSVALRRALQFVRTELYAALERPMPSARRSGAQ